MTAGAVSDGCGGGFATNKQSLAWYVPSGAVKSRFQAGVRGVNELLASIVTCASVFWVGAYLGGGGKINMAAIA